MPKIRKMMKEIYWAGQLLFSSIEKGTRVGNWHEKFIAKVIAWVWKKAGSPLSCCGSVLSVIPARACSPFQASPIRSFTIGRRSIWRELCIIRLNHLIWYVRALFSVTLPRSVFLLLSVLGAWTWLSPVHIMVPIASKESVNSTFSSFGVPGWAGSMAALGWRLSSHLPKWSQGQEGRSVEADARAAAV